MPDDSHGDRAAPSRRRRVLQRVALGVVILLVATTAGLFVAYRKLEGNITAVDLDLGTDRPEEVEVEGPTEPLTVLVMGSDSREGSNIGGDTPGLSDTTMLLHVSADRSRAYGVSLPRDLMVDRPECVGEDGEVVPGGPTQFNAAYAVGGPACTVRTVEAFTDVRVDHYVVIDFTGFKGMVDAVDGVEICVPEEVNDDYGKIYLPEGTYTVTGDQALDYVRVRNGLGAPTGDIGRVKRQQAFVASMIEKVMSRGTLANPVRLYNFLDAATKSLTTDPGFARLRTLAALGDSLQDIGLDNVRFITAPNQTYALDPNRLELAPEAEDLWRKVRLDQPLGSFGEDALVPGRAAGEVPQDGEDAEPTESPESPDAPPSQEPSPTASPDREAEREAAEQARVDAAREAGLCV